jgi:hypothetical protein
LAVTHLSIQTIDLTLPRAEPTLFEKSFQELNPVLEFPFFKKANVGGKESHLSILSLKGSFSL